MQNSSTVVASLDKFADFRVWRYNKDDDGDRYYYYYYYYLLLFCQHLFFRDNLQCIDWDDILFSFKLTCLVLSKFIIHSSH